MLPLKGEENTKRIQNTRKTQEDFHDIIIKNLVQSEILINRKNLVVDIGEPIYRSIELERSFGLMDFGKAELKN